ncbi:MAG: hypothetical protein U0892_06200 [Pirellulales bacterium]
MNSRRIRFKAAMIFVGVVSTGSGGFVLAQVPIAPSIPSQGLVSPTSSRPVSGGVVQTSGGGQASGGQVAVHVRPVSMRQDGLQVQAPVTQAPPAAIPAANEPSAQTPPSGGTLTPLDMETVRAPISAANIMVDKIGTQVFPEDQAAKLETRVIALPNGQERGISYQQVRWQAANVCHLPLYFEEPMLERHGVQRVPTVIQPAVSGTKFLGNLVLLPYKSTLQRPLENRYTLGHFRPGATPPALRDTLPWSPRAAAVQGAAATAVVVGLPW